MSVIWCGDLPPSYIPIPPTTVREILFTSTDWILSPGDELWNITHEDWRRERTVPVSLDLNAPCPTCEGRRTVRTITPMAEGGTEMAERCPTCKGSGVIPTLWHAEQQCRGWDPDEAHWTTWLTTIICLECDGVGHVDPPDVTISADQAGPCSTCRGIGRHLSNGTVMEDFCVEVERRLAVVARYTVQLIPVMPVYDGDDYPGVGCIVIEDDGSIWLWTHDTERNVSDESWAQGLVPGSQVLVLGERIELAEPIVEMVDPLDLAPGLNTNVELAA